jgi:head-tail adaptor
LQFGTDVRSGFVDTWRHEHPQVRGYTWYTKRKDKQTGLSADLNGFRLDYLFASPQLRHVISKAAILQAPRKAGASDHASVVLEIDVDPPAAQRITPSPIVAIAPEQQMESHRGPQATPSSSAAMPRGRDSLQEEILALLRHTDCHYGNTLRDEAGWTVEHAARERNVRTDRIVELRTAVRRVGNGEHSRTKAQAGHEDGVLRALLHFQNEMSAELRQHVDTRLAQLKAQFIPALKAVPLQCNTRGDSAAADRSRLSHASPCTINAQL